MWRRAFAFLIDLVPIGIVAEIENAAGIARYEPIAILNGLLWFLYFAGMNYWYGGTLGKRAVGLRVALPQSSPVRIQLIVRALVKSFSVVGLIGFWPLFWISAMMAVWRDDGRTLHDFAAGTTVVDAVSLTVPRRPNTLERLSASCLVIVAPPVFLIFLFVVLFGLEAFEEIMNNL